MCQDCERLHVELHKQAEEMFQLRRAITKRTAELRFERQEKAKLIKELKKGQKQHYRNGQKRGKTRNG